MINQLLFLQFKKMMNFLMYFSNLYMFSLDVRRFGSDAGPILKGNVYELYGFRAHAVSDPKWEIEYDTYFFIHIKYSNKLLLKKN